MRDDVRPGDSNRDCACRSASIVVLVLSALALFVGTAHAQFGSRVSWRLDSDADGLMDREEARIGTDPYQADTDGDGLIDSDEVRTGTDPLDSDTDGDGMSDGVETQQGTDPKVQNFALGDLQQAMNALDLRRVRQVVGQSVSSEEVDRWRNPDLGMVMGLERQLQLLGLETIPRLATRYLAERVRGLAEEGHAGP
jgi:hypothetical protein